MKDFYEFAGAHPVLVYFLCLIQAAILVSGMRAVVYLVRGWPKSEGEK